MLFYRGNPPSGQDTQNLVDFLSAVMLLTRKIPYFVTVVLFVSKHCFILYIVGLWQVTFVCHEPVQLPLKCVDAFSDTVVMSTAVGTWQFGLG